MLLSVSDLVQRLARLAIAPPGRQHERRGPRPSAAEGGCGCCPACREFVYLERPDAHAEAPCPRCGRMIAHLEPLGSEVGPGKRAPRMRRGRWIWIAVVFPVSAWLGMFTNFVLFGFNPGGSERKEVMWQSAVVLWPASMLLLLALAIRSANDPDRHWDWVATLVLMGTCPFWSPVACMLLVDCVEAVVVR